MKSNTEVKGKSVSINTPAYALYTAFSDLRHFVQNLPEDKKEGIVATADTIEGEVKGIRMGAQVTERVPFSYVKVENYGQTPFPFELGLYFDATESTKTVFHMEAKAELPFMIKMMIGGKLQELLDKITDQLALAAEGKISPEDMKNAMNGGF